MGEKTAPQLMNIHAQPFARLLFPLLLGILFGEFSGIGGPPLTVFLSATAVGSGILAFRKLQFEERNLFGIAAAVFLFLLGWHLDFYKDDRRAVDHFSKIPPAAEEVFFIAKLEEPPERTPKKLRARCSVRAIGPAAESLKNCSGNLLVYLDTTLAEAGFRYGDLLVAKGKIQPVPPPRNPSGFDYRQYLHFQNIHYQAFVTKTDVRLLPANRGNPFWKLAYASRDRFLKILKKHFPTPDEYAVASALLIGYKSDLSTEIKNAYIETGSMHALAVSGMHVGGLYLPLAYFFRRLSRRSRARRILEPLVSLAVIWGFTLITGASASVVRAAAMFTILVIGRALRRDAEIYNMLAASAFFILLANPYFLFDVGFQLSYAAVVGIVFFGKKFLKVWHPPRGLGWAWETVAMGLAAQLATLPISLHCFHQMPLYFWLSGLLVVPLGMVILWSGIVLFALDGIIPLAAAWLGKAMFWIVFLMNKGIFLIQKLPGSLVEGISFSFAAAVFLYLLIAAITAFWLEWKARWVVAILACFTLLAADRAFQKVLVQKTRRITVYSISGGSLVDFQSGEKLVSLTDTLSEKDLAFSTGKLARLGATSVFWETDTSFQTANLFYAPPFAQFFEKKMVVVGPETKLPGPAESEPIPVDFILFRKNPPLKIEEAMARFPCRAFIFDGSNSFFKIKKWSEECARLNIECHDLRKEGAFQTNL